MVEAPVDKGNVAFWSFFFLGAGILSPWNAFITAVDYFGAVYPGGHMDRKFSVCYIPPMLVVLLIMTHVRKGFPSHLRMAIGYSGFVVFLLLVPVIDAVLVKGMNAPPAAEAITLSSLVLTGILDGMAQGSVLGEASYLPDTYQKAYTSGTSASGVLISFLRIVTKAALPDTTGGLRVSTAIYFVSSALICAICLGLQMWVIPHLPIVKFYKKQESLPDAEEKETGDEQAVVENEDDTTGLVSSSQKLSTSRHLAKKLMHPSIALVIIYTTTLSIFPGVPAEDVKSKALGDWYGIILIAFYNIMDLIGKSSPTLKTLVSRPHLLTWLSMARTIFIALFLIFIKVAPNPVIFIILTCALGLTNGYLTLHAFIVGANCLSGDENEIGGNILISSLVLGLALGAALGWGVLALE